MIEHPHIASDALMQTSRKVFGFAISHAPDTIYSQSGKPLPRVLQYDIHDHLTIAYSTKNADSSLSSDEEDAFTLVMTGLDDTKNILTKELENNDSLTKEQALHIAIQPETIATIALIARHTHSDASHIIRKNDSEPHYGLDSTSSHLQSYSNLTPSPDQGCPFTALDERDKRTVIPDPLFQRFIAWAGQISVLSYYDHK